MPFVTTITVPLFIKNSVYDCPLTVPKYMMLSGSRISKDNRPYKLLSIKIKFGLCFAITAIPVSRSSSVAIISI